MGGSPPPSLLEAPNNTTGLLGETFTSQPDSSVCRESDWYVEQCLVLPLIGIQFQLLELIEHIPRRAIAISPMATSVL